MHMEALAWVDLIAPFFAWSLVMVALGYSLGRRSADGTDLSEPPPVAARAPRPAVPVSGETEARIEEALSSNRKIEAIKILREATGMGLKDAKEAIEARKR